MKKKVAFTLIVSLVSLLMIQCKKEKLQPDPKILEGITYLSDVQPIFTDNCGCHIANGRDVKESNLSTYESAKADDNLLEAIKGSMYKYFKDDKTKYQKVYSWIKTGYAQ